ncbi:hypothetical protein [Actinomadura luteofluorescens]|uniref:hypothetical protein n=1 Tax=Actinomadura luteofluorescens TaxID=46163 RepID=UPI002164DADD|nr:hypothetical protein [Actinomadura glauciflava]
MAQPEPASGVLRRVGIRQVVARTGRGAGEAVVKVDPGEFRCAGLVGELADEWVSYVELSRCTAGSAYGYRAAMIDFATFVDEYCDRPEAVSLGRDFIDVGELVREWSRQLPAGFAPGSTIPSKRSLALRNLLRLRAESEQGAAAGVLRLLASPNRVRPGRSQELDEFSRAEKRVLLRAAWVGVRSLERRLEAGRELVAAAAGDPRRHGWLDAANLAWALEAGQPVGDLLAGLPQPGEWPAELVELSGRDPWLGHPHWTKLALLRSLVKMLYPAPEDLQPFRVLLVAATGHAPEELTGLSTGDVEFVPSGVRLTMTKRRAGVVRHRVFSERDTQTATHAEVASLNAPEVLRRLLAATERARADCGLESVPLFLQTTIVAATRSVTFGPLNTSSEVGQFGAWVRAQGLQVTKPWSLRRMRKSVKVEKAIAMRGVVSDIADDHSVETYLGHYAHGTTLHVVSGQVVSQAQRTWLDRALTGPVALGDQALEELEEEPEALQALGLDRGEADRLRDGALDMGVTSCRNPFDSPYGERGELCAVAPLRCLECRNAFILPSNLPQLLLFSDHLDHLRKRLTPQHFHTLWGQSQANLRAVLSERTSVEIAAARTQITEEGLSLHLPIGARTEFHL